jgi:hypothetical protein
MRAESGIDTKSKLMGDPAIKGNFESVTEIFDWEYEFQLHHTGVLTCENIELPDMWTDTRKTLARKELHWQLYHVAKTLLRVIYQVQKVAGGDDKEFKREYTMISDQGLLGFISYFCDKTRRDLINQLGDGRIRITKFRQSLGSLKDYFFPLTIFSKYSLYNKLLQYKSLILTTSIEVTTLDFLFSAKRLSLMSREGMAAVHAVEESLSLYGHLEKRIETVGDLFSSQLSISGSFMTILGVTAGFLGIAVALPALTQWLAWIFALTVPLLVIEAVLFLRYSNASMIDAELQAALEILKRVAK